jgi:hypothetical protein
MAHDQATPATPDPTPTSTTNHLYDNPDLGPLDFLLAVMHSPEVDLTDRIAAAAGLLPYYQPPLKPSVRPWYTNGILGDVDCIVTIRIPTLN